MAANMVARSTDMNVKKADPVPNNASVLNVLGIEHIHAMVATIALKPMLQIE